MLDRPLDAPADPRELGTITIASPCKADWAQMTGDERVRFCALCKLNVYDLSAMTSEEARALITDKEGDLCVRFFQRADGTVLTRDCPEGQARARRRRVGSLVAAVSLAGAGLVAVDQLLPAGPVVEPPPATPLPVTVAAPPKPPATAPFVDAGAGDEWMQHRRAQFHDRGEPDHQLVMGRMAIVHVTGVDVLRDDPKQP